MGLELEAVMAMAAAFLPSSSAAPISILHVFVVLPVLAMLLLYLYKLSYADVVKAHIRSCWSNSTCTPWLPLPPGPVPWPVVGNLPEMMLSDKPAFRWVHKIMKHNGGTNIACIKLGGVHVVPITCPKIALEVLRNQDANFASRPLTMASKTFSRGYRDAVMSPHGDQWKKMRRVISAEIVCPSRHKWLHGKRADEADNLTRYVYNQCLSRGSGGGIDVRHVVRHYCGNVVRRLVFGTRYFGKPQLDGGPGPLEVQHVDAVFASVGLLYSFCVSDYLPWLLGLDIDGHERMVKEANERVTSLHDMVIDDRWRRHWKSVGGSERRMEPGDLLDVLIMLRDDEADKPLLSIEEVKALVMDIAMASVDNTSNAVEWALAEMVSCPEMLKKAVDEIDDVVGQERLVQESDIPRLNYVKACIREAFRLHPVAPFNLPHVALADTTVAGYRVPKGSHVIISRAGLGRNPDVWDDPLRFDPQRHIAAAAAANSEAPLEISLIEHDLRLISFSTGRRGCMAAVLGTAMTIMLFGRLLQGFSWRKMDGVAAIDLSEWRHDTSMACSLVLQATPRLPRHLYPGLSS